MTGSLWQHEATLGRVSADKMGVDGTGPLTKIRLTLLHPFYIFMILCLR